MNENTALVEKLEAGIARTVREIDELRAENTRLRPIGTDGKHGNLHTPTCQCEDVA